MKVCTGGHKIYQRIIDIIAAYLLQHENVFNEGHDIMPLILAELKQNNVTDAELEDLQRKYDALVAQTTAEMKTISAGL